jgi:hypothetical protein
MRSENGVISFQ